jgi:tRNA (uracil-5-)-methyltransferase
MNCDYFGMCGSCTLYDKNYDQQLEHKVQKIKEDFDLQNLDIITSKHSHFRCRAEFKIYHDDDGISYAMNTLEKRGFVKIESCSIVDDTIASIMPKLLREIRKNQILKERLFAAEFLTSQKEELLITLIYHKKIDEIWKVEAKKLAETLDIDLIGRSRGIKIVVTKEYIDESLTILDKEYLYRLYDTGFTQPNTTVNQKMIGWVKQKIEKNRSDLLELYCGHGNFTIPLSENFRYVLATEVSKRSINTAIENAKVNSITNIEFVRLSSKELTEALNRTKKFKRLKDVELDKFSFDTVFVDPPRAGLDCDTLEFIKDFNHIIYISCNPQTLKRDLKELKATHNISNFAVFDQFCYTDHLECGVILTSI